MIENKRKKIALIGATGYKPNSEESRVECFSWDKLKKARNLADYDILVLNLLSLGDRKHLDAESFRAALNVQTTHDILTSDGEIFVLGDPRFDLEVGHKGREDYSEPFLSWTGLKFAWDGRPGTSVVRHWDAKNGIFKTFADSLKSWDYSLVQCCPCFEDGATMWNAEAIHGAGLRLTAVVKKICCNRYENALIFSVVHAVEQDQERAMRPVSSSTKYLSSPIFFIPEIELAEEEMLELVLRNLCGVDVSAPEPEWIAEFVAPGQEQIDDELSQLNTQIDELIEQFNSKVEERDEVRKPLKLLYESGGALEEAVWSVLEELGAGVERPEVRNKEDGWITVVVGDETLEGVLEVKSTDKQHFTIGGLRQLYEWIERGITFRQKQYTGLFVGNSSIKEPPRARPWPFHKNWIESAELRQFAAIRSEDLYVLYLLDCTDRFDRDEFWRRLFSTTGAFDMRPYRKKLTDEENQHLGELPQP
jgi:hypothetical protein